MDHAEAKQRYSGAFLRCLLELDVDGIVELHRLTMPDGTAPSSRAEALASLHLARTKALGVPIGLKRYSQRWLNERGLGSWLPDHSDRRE